MAGTNPAAARRLYQLSARRIAAAAPASRPPAFVLPPPEPWDPSRLRPPHALDAARRGAAVPRATGGGAAPDAGDPLAALRAASREALGAPPERRQLPGERRVGQRREEEVGARGEDMLLPRLA